MESPNAAKDHARGGRWGRAVCWRGCWRGATVNRAVRSPSVSHRQPSGHPVPADAGCWRQELTPGKKRWRASRRTGHNTTLRGLPVPFVRSAGWVRRKAGLNRVESANGGLLQRGRSPAGGIPRTGERSCVMVDTPETTSWWTHGGWRSISTTRRCVWLKWSEPAGLRGQGTFRERSCGTFPGTLKTRLPARGPGRIWKTCSSCSGIAPGSSVVFYGYGPAIGFWLMKLYGHRDVRVLDFSRDAWKAEGRPSTAEVTVPASTGYSRAGTGQGTAG